ncbi:MAG: CPBP family intramembrane metalloprotease [Candidatus Thorarchaeota archaeon]|nr:CPBP family intramembrane metalloprotease [Candidatus Thorarchaeota archaeon]NIW15725.1 CPBP family intramembrane metalloprotease [Candidatus Thorarchaeota archaeon]NIW53650.1 CPBP family intramembrane metalloprotease [Candidatus Korarchaeota archaeon]
MLGIVMFIITAFYNHLEKETTEWNVKRDAIWALYFIFVNAFFEELFYRGWMQTIIFSHIPFFPANLLLSAFIFGIQHRLFFGSSVRNCVFYGVGGIFLGFVFYTSGNLMEVWTIHAFADLGLGGGKYLFHWGEWKDIPGKNIEPT